MGWRTIALVAALVVLRTFNALTIKTFFQPDEYWQSLEPAHIAVYGYGYQTWEWREQLRSAAHPLLYAGIFKLADMAGVDIVLAPKLFQGVMAAVGDYYQYVLAKRVLGGSGAWIALAASVGSAFNWFCITRTFSNSLEMVLTTMALAFWPWNGNVLSVDHYVVSLVVAALSCVFRPTNAIIWLYLGVRLLYQTKSIKLAAIAVVSVLGSITANFWVDYWYYGEPVLPLLKFIEYNVIQSLSQFYGTSPWHYYIFQGVPILLIAYLPVTLAEMWNSRTSPITLLVLCVIGVYSLLAHKEVRFIYPLLPLLHLLFAKGVTRLSRDTKLQRRVVTALIFINAPVAFYFTQYHQRGVVDVIDYLRSDPNVLSTGVLMPCHSTPWQSHLHRNMPAWFLTCEPPLHLNDEQRTNYLDIADLFYENPLQFMRNHFPGDYGWPSHLVMFEQVVPEIGGFLKEHGYHLHKSFFNSHFHDDHRRVGDVLVYTKY